ncbi:hypothetical protein AN216_17390 [Streptomyces oceani]|uniref:Uncharacterized protein n=1 Tax=Streptomyces oceani TaxID=1075402 RepID=A0A1E7JZD3_9ACTN|nr:hypothetical protein AN216_17390 [Streptomyces oceani]
MPRDIAKAARVVSRAATRHALCYDARRSGPWPCHLGHLVAWCGGQATVLSDQVSDLTRRRG